MRLLGEQAEKPDFPYCVGVCTCGNDCHNNADYHQEVTNPLNTLDRNAPAILTSFTSVDTNTDVIWRW